MNFAACDGESIKACIKHDAHWQQWQLELLRTVFVNFKPVLSVRYSCHYLTPQCGSFGTSAVNWQAVKGKN